jgi:arylsulfatase A-like enzyme
MRKRVALPILSAAFACAGLLAFRSGSVLFDLRSTLAKYGSAYASGSSYSSNDTNSRQQRRDAESFSSSSTSSSSSAVGDDMNIVLFYADDWTIKTLGIFNDKALTPNLDAMAERGMAFTHNSVTTSLCWQSRATKVTGVYKAVHNQSRFWDTYMFDQTVRWSDTLYPKLFSAGYHVGYIGKWHAPLPTEYRRVSFDHFQAYSGSHWRRRDGRMRHITDLNGEDALAYLRKHIQKKEEEEEEEDGGSEKDPKAAGSTHGGGKPGASRRRKFALTLAFFATHAQDYSRWPNGYEPDNFTQPLYKNTSGTYPRPPTATQQAWGDMPWFFTDNNEGRRRWKLRFDTEDHRQESVERIYRMATEVDKVVGDVMDEVKKMGVYDNTLFMFTTDNGVFHGGTLARWGWDVSRTVDACRSANHSFLISFYSFHQITGVSPTDCFVLLAEHGLADKVRNGSVRENIRAGWMTGKIPRASQPI